jgi:hypothetical protein
VLRNPAGGWAARGLWRTVLLDMIEGGIAAGGFRIITNLLTGQPWNQNLGPAFLHGSLGGAGGSAVMRLGGRVLGGRGTGCCLHQRHFARKMTGTKAFRLLQLTQLFTDLLIGTILKLFVLT